MSTNVIVTDGTVGGTNTNVVKVISQTIEISDSIVNAEANKGYILSDVSLQTVNLPSSPGVGDIVYLQGDGTGLFKIAQAINEQIIIGDTATTLGAGGFLDSTNQGDSIYLVCVSVSTDDIWRNSAGFAGEFLIDGVTPVNTTYEASGGDLNFTSPGGNVDIGGTSPNFTLDAGKATSSTSIAMTNVSVPDVGSNSVAIGQAIAQSNHGNSRVSIGFGAGQTNGGSNGVAIGRLAGKSGQGLFAIAIGQNAGENVQGDRAIAIGYLCGTQADTETVSIGYACGAGCCPYVVNIGAQSGGRAGNYAVNLGYNAGDGIVDPNFSGDYSVSIGANCLAPSVDGRLAFGNNMEAVTPIGVAAASQQGYLTLEWNGSPYRVPVYNDTADAPIFENNSPDVAFIRMISNAWSGFSFAFTTAYQELAPAGATYASVLPSNFTNPSNAQLQYIGADTRQFKISCHVDTNQTGNDYAIALSVNGVTQVASGTYFVSEGFMVLKYVQTLSQNDIASVHVLRSSNVSRNIISFSFTIEA